MGAATDKGYTTSAKIASYLGVTITDDLSAFILATQLYIENFTGRYFKADTNASERLYNGGGGQMLAIDDCIEITKVERGDNYYADSWSTIQAKADGVTDYYDVLPENYAAENLPINRVFLRNRFWIIGIKNCRITAKWGYSETPPEDLMQAATILAAGMYNANQLKGNGNIKSEKIGNYSVSFDTVNGQSKWNDLTTANMILDKYKKFLI